MKKTVPTVVNGGRGPSGKFARGNAFARGNPVNKRVQRLRIALIRAVTVSDLRDVVSKLLEQAKSGDLVAMRLLFDRVLGQPLTIPLPSPTMQETLDELNALTS